ncbi:hypothetical protein ATPR_2142 [Acetobacter tropicalis NBRC 101654]|uniref:Uncharacterized protein n=1 Tax=Acetobacter tropicalis NBRC 101654 TaxID=749388 RepID=F7VFJ3_9PROT|nr:hypothetical protein ATPR_2142 [Acetobacter tropicalis NBRC 101654]
MPQVTECGFALADTVGARVKLAASARSTSQPDHSRYLAFCRTQIVFCDKIRSVRSRLGTDR